ncbi:MAG: YjgP/YjgQ family permease [Verrucomicrobia bacterium]|nr:MAG: YjgP/YjgQ family permease [Verrucomicrobiota bacterium]
MRITDRYISKQVIQGTCYAVGVLALVLVLGNLFKQIQPLLVEQKAPLSLVFKFVLAVIPLSFIYTVPWGFLTAVLLVFNRLSAQHELTGLRAAGISLVRLSMPVFVIGMALSLVSLWLNTNVVPLAKFTSLEILYNQAKRDPDSLLKPGVVQGSMRSDQNLTQKLLIEGKSGEWVEGFHFYQIPNEMNAAASGTYVHARRAKLAIDEKQSQLRLQLEDAYFENKLADGKIESVLAGKAEPLLIDLKESRGRRLRESAMTNRQIVEEIGRNLDLTEKKQVDMRAEITRRYSFSMACFAFAFVAVPLGIQSQRRESSNGLILSLIIGACYFLFTMVADYAVSDRWATIALWLPNGVCILLGIILFRRVRFK